MCIRDRYIQMHSSQKFHEYIFDYIRTKGEQKRECIQKLYDNPGTVLSIFRALDNLQRQFVIRMVNIEKIPESSFKQYWINSNEKANENAYQESIKYLRDLGIFEGQYLIQGQKKEDNTIRINQNFKNSLLKIWQNGIIEDGQNGYQRLQGKNHNQERELYLSLIHI
eukprot:TRINITY_DN4653_c0_g3_i3.p1 TRINITY_DN4653_c0_g3~~TRINITY_DN4653_c0_g3_i3.p1  ORF type:complete len:167 (-),score=17.04 TRINITY_DN4653_c0_g3_i3:172-672(-)